MADSISNNVTIDEIRELKRPTDIFMCKLSDNVYKVEFLKYRIRDMVSKLTLVEIDNEEGKLDELPDEITDEDRKLKYKFGPDFLEFETIGTELIFKVGD